MNNAKVDNKLTEQVEILVDNACQMFDSVVERNYQLGAAFNAILDNTNSTKLAVSNLISETFKSRDHVSAKSFYNPRKIEWLGDMATIFQDVEARTFEDVDGDTIVIEAMTGSQRYSEACKHINESKLWKKQGVLRKLSTEQLQEIIDGEWSGSDLDSAGDTAKDVKTRETKRISKNLDLRIVQEFLVEAIKNNSIAEFEKLALDRILNGRLLDADGTVKLVSLTDEETETMDNAKKERTA
jgi:hypothetical protein